MCFYINQNVIIKHRQRCSQQEITSIRKSNESHVYWEKKHFHMNPLYFPTYAIFEADNDFGNCNRVFKTTNVYEENPVCNGYYVVTDLSDVLECGNHESLLA